MERIRWILVGAVLLAIQSPIVSADWYFTPSLILRETYTDNFSLQQGGAESAWLTEINPGISISNTGRGGGAGLGGGGLGGGG
ncbi:MAG: hypothetical protein JXR29_04355, partial [Methylothermaceae bacterium]|nr:hypothetical protein [Methylothermaceae bacterium]